MVDRAEREQYLLSLLPSRKNTLASEYRRAMAIPATQPLRPGMPASEMMMAILNREFPANTKEEDA
jgi:hypothetical protein